MEPPRRQPPLSTGFPIHFPPELQSHRLTISRRIEPSVLAKRIPDDIHAARVTSPVENRRPALRQTQSFAMTAGACCYVFLLACESDCL